jgi:ABC-type phosphate transport system auxiliary subunit
MSERRKEKKQKQYEAVKAYAFQNRRRRKPHKFDNNTDSKKLDKIVNEHNKLQEKYNELKRMYHKLHQEIYEMKKYAPEFGTEYFKVKEEFERIQKMTT